MNMIKITKEETVLTVCSLSYIWNYQIQTRKHFIGTLDALKTLAVSERFGRKDGLGYWVRIQYMTSKHSDQAHLSLDFIW